jgi:flagellar hook capping protein FlgD
VHAALHSVAADAASCGFPVTTAPNGQVHASIASDGAQGAIVTWQDARSARVNIFAQHLFNSGAADPAWPVDGRALLTDSVAMATASGGQTAPVIIPDGAGGAIVAWQDLRSAVTETDVFAQHVLANGVVDPNWKENGVALCTIEGEQKTLAMISDGAGGAIVTWMDSRPGTSVTDIFAQHVLASGIVDPRWPANGATICAAPRQQELPVIVADGAGGAIISWHDARSLTTGLDIYAQHVLESGALDRAWPVDGRAICEALGDQGGPTITRDATNGAIVAWSDSRVAGTSHIFAHHVLGPGVVDAAWPVNGRAISGAATSEGAALAVSDGVGGAIVSWQAVTAHLNVFAQHVRATGVVDPGWPAGGRALSLAPRLQTHTQITADGAGGAIVAWDEDSQDVVAQHVLATGTLDPAYPANGRSICALASQQGDPALVATGDGGAIVAWTDNRGGVSTDIFAVQVLSVDTADVPPPPQREFTFARATPNPGRGLLTLRFALTRRAQVRLVVYDLTGRRVRELVAATRSAGEQAVTWDLRDDDGRVVQAGLYVARLDVEGLTATQKLVALK